VLSNATYCFLQFFNHKLKPKTKTITITQETIMTTSSDHVAKLIANPKYQALVKKRNSINNTFFIIMLVVYAGFILLVAFANNLMEQPIGNMTMSVGVALGTLVLVSASIMIIAYTIICNRSIDPALKEVLKEVQE
jgi:uncharacterized membrane protein (DUF485 family)